MNVYLDTKNQVHLLTPSCMPLIHYLKVLYACLGAVKNTQLIKLIYECIPICKKASPYFKSLKYYLKELWACLDIILKKTALICDSLGSIPICEKLT